MFEQILYVYSKLRKMDNINIIQATLGDKISVNKGLCSIINTDNERTDLIRDMGDGDFVAWNSP